MENYTFLKSCAPLGCGNMISFTAMILVYTSKVSIYCGIHKHLLRLSVFETEPLIDYVAQSTFYSTGFILHSNIFILKEHKQIKQKVSLTAMETNNVEVISF